MNKILSTSLAALLLTLSIPALAAPEASKPSAAIAAAPAKPRPGVGIAAVVNDDIITFSDISDRFRLYLGGAPTPTETERKALEEKVLSKLIDEKLQMQEAKLLDIVVDEATVQNGFSNIAAQNNSSPEEFKKRLQGAGVKAETLLDQIRAEIAWSQVARRKLRPQITVSESEIDSEIAMPSVTAAPAAGAAPPEKIQPGETLVHIKQLVIPFSPNDPEAIITAKIARAAALKTEIRSCAAMDAKMKEFPAPGTKDMGLGALKALPPPLRAAIEPLEVGQLSAPVRGQNGVAVLMVCEKKQADAATASAMSEGQPASTTDVVAPTQGEDLREQVANRIGLQRMQKMQERYLRDLRATAFIDKRL